jgi:hypothetical protein
LIDHRWAARDSPAMRQVHDKQANAPKLDYFCLNLSKDRYDPGSLPLLLNALAQSQSFDFAWLLRRQS